MDLFSKAEAAVKYVRERAQVSPKVGVILGSVGAAALLWHSFSTIRKALGR